MVSQELIELLKYMEHSTDEVSEQCKSERIQKMHRRVCRIKASEKTEVKYMQAWEEKLLERQKEKRELLRKMNHKMSIEEIADVLGNNMIQRIKSENNRNERDHLTLFGWSLLPFLYGYTVPVIVRVLNPGLELHSPVVSLTVNVAAGTVTFPAPVAKVPVVLS